MNGTSVGIVVGGGPAPGINGVISAATIEAINRGHRVLGIADGFKHIMHGDSKCIRQLSIKDVSRIHAEGGSILGTSRANPTSTPEHLEHIVRILRERDVGYLVTIGGDDTVSSAMAISEAAGGTIAVGHVPKTIDNDLPLPDKWSTFGFQTAREVGATITDTLMRDAKTTGRWYLVVAMGRKAGHLALGIGVSSVATLTLIPEEFDEEKISISFLADIIVGSILKRLANDQPYGVAVLAEGLAERLDPDSLPELVNPERDPHGNIRFAELNFPRLVKTAVRNRLQELGVEMLVVENNVGYELRCCSPNSFDVEYTRELGYGVVDFLLGGGSGAMISRQGDALVPIPFEDFIDSKTRRSQVRLVDLNSVAFRVGREYMLRLEKGDLDDGTFLRRLEGVCSLSQREFRKQFMPVADWNARTLEDER